MIKPRRTRDRDRLRDPDTGEWDMEEVRHRSKGWIAVAVALVVVFGGVWFFGGKAFKALLDFRTKDDYIGAGVTDIEIEIPRGTTMRQIGVMFQEADIVKSADTFRQYAQSRPEEAAKVQAGTYRMRTQMSAAAAFERLLDPANIIRNMIQLREGQRLTEQIASLAEQTKLPRADFEALVADPASLKLPAWANGKPEGFLFPDTYELPNKPTAQQVMSVPIEHFKKVTAELEFEKRAAASPAKDAYTALIMASLIEREATRDEDRAKAARVFYNRLAQKMPLQSDATVAYANNITGRVFTTAQERQIDSPYNTYKNPGLMPGPITSPSRSAMEAALAPAEGNWLYFVVVNLDTGETEFNDTLEAHNASNEKFQNWCKTQAPGRCK
ncbi:MAG: endolytic transglycosylase MltG [Propioniciclava sp.]|uniref:endolytic transglycosylase MltG n=1 Tax=Propioniciclava sp. TaxID=2038686 RepID=UPI0039E399E0